MAESSDAITGKFDFYDILGYLVPGLTFIGLVTLPFGLIRGHGPPPALPARFCIWLLPTFWVTFCKDSSAPGNPYPR